MPSKGRWTLNPRKWFGPTSKFVHKRDKQDHTINTVIQLPPTATKTTRTYPTTTSIVPHILTSRNKKKIIPTSSINDNNYTKSTNTLASFTQLQLPPFIARREKTSVSMPSSATLFNRTNTFIPPRIEPSIRKNSQIKEELSIDVARWSIGATVYDTSKSPISSSLSSQYRNNSQQNSSEKQLEKNISKPCLIVYPPHSLHDFIEKSSSPRRSRSSSLSIDDNYENDESSSSGIFTDERAESIGRPRTASKDTLEVLSIASTADSQTSLNHCQSRPLLQPYRLPLLKVEKIDNKSSKPQRRTPIVCSSRSHSAENILKDNQVVTPVTTKSCQSSAAIVKKIEKRTATNQIPSIALEKAGFVRIANATYRLSVDKDDHLYRRQRQNSIIQYSNNEDSLPPANNEESYARLPRTSSTEQLDNNLQNDLRAMVHDCLRPMINSVNKTTYRQIKSQHRSKRPQKTNTEHTQIDIDNITDKLLSSVDCSTYAQYQRCY